MVTDGLQLKAGNTVVHLAFVMDLHSRFILCHNSSLHEDGSFYNELLRKLNLNMISDHSDCILHTDHGSVFTSLPFNEFLFELGITHSMSAKGTPTDNCMIENFHRILQEEIYYDKKYSNSNELNEVVNDFVHYYNYKRISFKEGTTPFERMLDFYKEQFDVSNIKNLQQLLNLLEN